MSISIKSPKIVEEKLNGNLVGNGLFRTFVPESAKFKCTLKIAYLHSLNSIKIRLGLHHQVLFVSSRIQAPQPSIISIPFFSLQKSANNV